jgi:hypothetical protein
MPLIFSKLYKYNDAIVELNRIGNVYGIYVWGFKFPNVTGNRDRFLPYYVGMAGGALSGGALIKTRLYSHYNFSSPYNILNVVNLPNFRNLLKTDTAVGLLNQLDYNNYSFLFTYLNIKFGGGPKLNGWGSYIKTEADKTAIQYYQNNFYVCWIPMAQNDPRIPILEANINYNITIIQSHILYGKTIAYDYPYPPFLIDPNPQNPQNPRYPQNNQIDVINQYNLKEDKFLI